MRYSHSESSCTVCTVLYPIPSAFLIPEFMNTDWYVQLIACLTVQCLHTMIVGNIIESKQLHFYDNVVKCCAV